LKKPIIIFSIVLILCSCTSTKNITYSDYENIINLVYLQIENFYIPAFDVSIDNNNFHAIYQTGYRENIICKDVLDKLEIKDIDDKNVIISKIILNNGIVLDNVAFTVIEPNNDVIKLYFGLSAFNDYNVLLSYKQNKIFLYDNNTLPNYLDSWVSVPVVFPETGLYIYTIVKGSLKPYLTWLCSGVTFYIGNFKRHYNIVVNRNVPIATFFKSSVYIDGKEYRNLYFFNSLSDDNKKDHNLDDTLTDIILGYDFFSKYDIFIENNSKKVYIEKI